jgi:syntaxin-binding protein 5
MIIFSGGMPYAHQSKSPPSITVMTGKSITVLEMEHAVVDFVVLCETPWCHGEA